tara:strand:- start:6600 stop:7019 length:420 start_codon:yes stop_codon:yes gene_type:complete
MMITAVPIEGVDIVWEDAKKVLHKSVETSAGKFEVEDLRQELKAGQLVLWLVMDGSEVLAALTSRVIEYPGRRAMALDWVGGKRMSKWLPLVLNTLQKYATDCECKHIEGYGRKAWGRILQKYGWKPEYIAYRMELNNG